MRIERHVATFAAVALLVGSFAATPALAGWDETYATERIVVESTTPKEATDPDAGARRHTPTSVVSSTPAPMAQVTPLHTWLDAWRQLIAWLAG